jgi:hypothetical protein
MSDLHARIAREAELHGLGWIDNGKPDAHCYCGYRPRIGESWHYHVASGIIRDLGLREERDISPARSWRPSTINRRYVTNWEAE